MKSVNIVLSLRALQALLLLVTFLYNLTFSGSTTSASTSTETSNEPEAAAAAAEAATVIDPLAHEVELCGGGSARPYNRGRSKPRTERLVLGITFLCCCTCIVS
jgi:hypothetical protein